MKINQSSHQFDVFGICNALMDMIVSVNDHDLAQFELRKGAMHLVDFNKQKSLLDKITRYETVMELGGSIMNTIRTLAMLGKKTAFAGMVGNDSFADKISERMSSLNIGNYLGTSQEMTGVCLIFVTPDGERTMNTCLGASRLYNETHIPRDAIASSKILMFSGYQWDTEGQKKGIKEAIKQAKLNDREIFFDVSDTFLVERNRDDFLRVIKEDADVIFANEEEARSLFSVGPEEAAKKIAQHGTVAVVKLGAKGALVQKGTDTYRIEARPVKVIDTTAAGDIFAAGFIHGYLSGKSLDQCGKIATLLAGDVVSRVGSVVSKEAIDRAIRFIF